MSWTQNTNPARQSLGNSSAVCGAPATQSNVSFMSEIQVQVLERAAKNYKAEDQLKRDDVIALSWVFGNTIEHAMELVDRELVSVLKSPSNRVIINVRGSEETYWIPPGAAVCQCQSYIHGLKPICKHIIAAHFVLASLCPSEYYSISDAELTHRYKKFFKDCAL